LSYKLLAGLGVNFYSRALLLWAQKGGDKKWKVCQISKKFGTDENSWKTYFHRGELNFFL